MLISQMDHVYYTTRSIKKNYYHKDGNSHISHYLCIARWLLSNLTNWMQTISNSLGLWQYKVTEKTNFNKVFSFHVHFRCGFFFFGFVSSIYSAVSNLRPFNTFFWVIKFLLGVLQGLLLSIISNNIQMFPI